MDINKIDYSLNRICRESNDLFNNIRSELGDESNITLEIAFITGVIHGLVADVRREINRDIRREIKS